MLSIPYFEGVCQGGEGVFEVPQGQIVPKSAGRRWCDGVSPSPVTAGMPSHLTSGFWGAQVHLPQMATCTLALWLLLCVWGVVASWGVKRVPHIVLVQRVRGRGSKPSRGRWLGDWGSSIVASSVGSFAPALAPQAPLWLQALLMVVASVGLLRLLYALDSREVGQGVVVGLGLIALFLDSLSGSAWARHGALGHGMQAAGVGELYGSLAILWSLVVIRAWLQIEGNPLGAAYLSGLVALWLGWKGQTPALGWSATATALTLGWLVLQREWSERRRVRIALQNQPARVVKLPQGYDLVLHGAILLGLCAVALWLSGIPMPQIGGFSLHDAGYAALATACLVGIARVRFMRPLPPALQRAWLVGTLCLALLCEPRLSAVALCTLVYWGLVGAMLQERYA
ncbi:MAG: hypothetical protein NZ874_05725 [Fimbriimonadales bacterium]|nr:hypothetical protein [Fimbriimonadales bacterium]